MYKYVFLVIYFIASTSGATLIKMGEKSPLSISLANGFNFSIGWISFLGYLLYICSFLMFTKIITMFELSYIMPINFGVLQILTLASAIVILNERVTLTSALGVLLVISGIIVMNLNFATP